MRRLLGTKAEGSTTGAGGIGVAALVTGAAVGAGAPQPPQSAFESHLLQLKSEASKLGRRQQLDFLAPQQSALGAAHDALGAAQLALGAQPLSQLFLQPNRPKPRLQQSDLALPQQSAFGAAQVALGAAHVALGAAQLALGAQQLALGAQPQLLPSS